MTEHEPRERCESCRKILYPTWADAQHSIRTTRLYRNGRGLKAYRARDEGCTTEGFHIGEGHDHAYRNRERHKTRDAKRATWARLEEGLV